MHEAMTDPTAPDLAAARKLAEFVRERGFMPRAATVAGAMPIEDDALLRRILRQARTIAVVGLSADWFRPSYFAAKYMQQHGCRIRPVNPRYAGQLLLGMPCVARLEDIDEPVDLVDVFRRSEDVLPIAEAAIRIGAKVLWQQIGVVNRDADALVQAAGLASVMNRCVKIEHARLFGGLHWAGVDTGVISARRGRAT